MLTQQELKQQAADAALELVEQVAGPDVIIGVGTGSTADLFIDGLACFKGRLRGTVASSERSAARLAGHGLAVLDLNDVQSMPIYVDGADEIDPNLHMIKGGGGALTREKIVASVARRYICIADESKLVERLGRFPLPVEVIPMARNAVARGRPAGRPAGAARRLRYRQWQHHPGRGRPVDRRRAGAGEDHQRHSGRGDLRPVRPGRRRCGAAGHPGRHPPPGAPRLTWRAFPGPACRSSGDS